MKSAIILVVVAAVAFAGPMVKRQAATTYSLPDGAELVVGSVTSSFSCEGQIYGYYADVANNCKVFHVCAPSADGQRTQIYSFFCGNQTVFDQENLVCVHPGSSKPCSDAPSLYSVNLNFGKLNP